MKKKLNIFSNHEALLFLLTIIVRGVLVFYLLEPSSYLRWLPFQNDRRGLDLATGRIVNHPEAWSSYYLFLGGLYAMLKPVGLIDYRIQIVVGLNVLLGAAAVVAFYRILKIFVDRKISFIGGVIFSVYYPAIYLNSMVMSENLFSVALILGILLLSVKPAPKTLVAAGNLLGISMIIRPILLAFFPLLGWWLLRQTKRDWLLLKSLLLVFFPIVGIVVSVSVVNSRMGNTTWRLLNVGENGGVNFAIAQCELKKISYSTASGDAFWFSPPVFWGTNRPEIKTGIPFSNQGYYYRMGWECLKGNPANLGRNLIHIKNVFASIFYPDFENSIWHRSMFLFWKAVGVGLSITLLIFPFVTMNRLQSRARSLLILLFLSLPLAVFWENPGEERYLVPYFFILLISGAVVTTQGQRGTIENMKKALTWPALWWLRFWARVVLRKINPFIIGITGSAGKSSAVAAAESVIKLKFPRLKVARKANSESGIPADILGLHFGESSSPIADWIRICLLAPFNALHSAFRIQHSEFDCYLVEMGVDDPRPPKNMGYLLTILQPDVGVILNALPVHTEQFGSVESIATEKGKLVTRNPNLKLAIINADQPEINRLKPVTAGVKIYTFGKTPKSTVGILSIKPSLEGTEIALQYNKLKYFIKLNRLALPDFYAHTFAAAFVVGISLGLNPKDVANAISTGFILPAGRGQIFSGIKKTTIIDSSYNASGETTVGSLRLLKTVAGKRRKIAVLGDMRELGSQAEKEHLAVAKTILETVDEAVLVGPLMKECALPILLKSGKPVNWFLTAGEAARFLMEVSQTSMGKFAKLRGGEVVLVKGSQNTIFLEIVVEALLSNKEDVEKLCRRGKFWDRQRKPYI